MTTTDISAAAALLGRKGGSKGGKARSESKTAAARANGQKGGRRPVFFTADSITPMRLAAVAVASITAAKELDKLVGDVDASNVSPSEAAKLANAALYRVWRVAQGR